MMMVKIQGKAEIKSFVRHSLGITYIEFGRKKKKVSDQYLITYSITVEVALL